MARIGYEYLTANQHTAFPFAEDAAGLEYAGAAAHGANATLPLDFLIDAVICVPAGVTAVYLAAITAQPGGHQFRFADQDGATLLEYVHTPSAAAIVGTSDETASTTIRLLKGASFDTHLAAIVTTDTFGTRLPFEQCVLDVRPARVETLQLYRTLTTPCPSSPSPFKGHVRLVAGYNIAYDPVITDTVDTTAIRLAAVPGAGAGRVPCDGTASDPKPPSMIQPDGNGSVHILGDDCYSVYPIAEDTLQISGDCYACCTCDQYVNVARAVAALIARANAVRLALADQLVVYSQALQEYHTRHFPAVRRMYMTVKAISGLSSRQGSADSHGQIAVTLSNAADSVTATNIRLNVTVYPNATCVGGGGTYSFGTGYGSPAVGAVAYPEATLPDMDAGIGAAIIYRVKTGNPAIPVSSVTVTLTYTLGSVTKTLTVAQPFEYELTPLH